MNISKTIAQENAILRKSQQQNHENKIREHVASAINDIKRKLHKLLLHKIY